MKNAEHINDEVPSFARESGKITDSLPDFIRFASSEGTIKYFNKGGLEYTSFLNYVCIVFEAEELISIKEKRID